MSKPHPPPPPKAGSLSHPGWQPCKAQHFKGQNPNPGRGLQSPFQLVVISFLLLGLALIGASSAVPYTCKPDFQIFALINNYFFRQELLEVCFNKKK